MRSRALGYTAFLAATLATVACGLSVVGQVDSSAEDAGADVTTERGRAVLPDSSDDDVPGDEHVMEGGGKADADATVADADADAADAFDANDAADTSDGAAPCPELGAGGLRYSNGHCYFVLPATTQAAGIAACVAVGAHLVTITSQGEQTFVEAFSNGVSRWIGLTQPTPTNSRMNFVWVTGEPMPYGNWQSDQPNDMSLCAAMADNNLWSDRMCGNAYPIICERE